MSNIYWIGNISNNVNTAGNWSLYPLTGATLPPASSSVPATGDIVYFNWSGYSGSQPLYGPQGTLSASLSLVAVQPNFELDIGSASTPLGLSSDNIVILKKYQSDPTKSSEDPSVFITSTGNNTHLVTSLWGDAPIPAAFTGGFAQQCVMQFNGTYRRVSCGDAIGTFAVPVTRSETIIFGNVSATDIGGYDAGDPTFIMSPSAKTTLIFGPEVNVLTPEVSYGVNEPINFIGDGITVKLQRGADFASNCGGIIINSASGLDGNANNLIFTRSAYAGATGFDQSSGRTTVKDLKMLPSIETVKNDPYVLIEHGVDITGELHIASGTFKITECQEATRTYGAAAKATLIVNNTFQNTPRMELDSNCSIRKITVHGNTISPPDIIVDPRPLKSLFINQSITEGYTGL